MMSKLSRRDLLTAGLATRSLRTLCGETEQGASFRGAEETGANALRATKFP